jgi:hypothetical protein
VSVGDDGGWTVNCARACRVGSSTLVAVTFTQVGTSTAGAVKRPLEETLPWVVDQVTAGSVAFCTTPVNCRVSDAVTVALLGVTVTVIGGITVAVAVADFVGSATLVAVIRTVVVAVTFGEVNIPPEIVPCVTVHVTRVC